MSLSDPQTQNGKRSRETSEVFEPVFNFLMDFADTAKTIVPQIKRRVIDPPTNEEEPSENLDDGNAGEIFGKLPVEAKEELLKGVFGEIVGNMLNRLPDDGKEAFLVRCFVELLPKLPDELRRDIEAKVKDVFSQSLEAADTPDAPGLPSIIPNRFPTEDRRPAGYIVTYPDVIGKGGKGGAGGKGNGGGTGGAGGGGKGGGTGGAGK